MNWDQCQLVWVVVDIGDPLAWRVHHLGNICYNFLINCEGIQNPLIANLQLPSRLCTIHQTSHTTIQKFLQPVKSTPLQIRKHFHPKIQKIHIQPTILLVNTKAPRGPTAAYCFKLPNVTGPGCRTVTLGSASSNLLKI